MTILLQKCCRLTASFYRKTFVCVYLLISICDVHGFTNLCEYDIKESRNHSTVKTIWKEAQAVCFDVDSTVSRDEGIDVLAEYCGVGKEVQQLTHKAMGGSVLFQDAFDARLRLIQPTESKIASCLSHHPPVLTKGGIVQMIEPIAKILGVKSSNIYANTLLYNQDGTFAGFNTTSPTSRDGGKASVIQEIKKKMGYSPIVMIGDGITDMQARPPADAFIGYGGVVVRKAVQEGADWFITDFDELIQELKN